MCEKYHIFQNEINKCGFEEDFFDVLNQEAMEELLEHNIRQLDERLDLFRHEFPKQFHGYSPELFLDLLHAQNLKISSLHG